jgi:hypothetical protein
MLIFIYQIHNISAYSHLALEDYEEELLMRLYDEGIIGMDYRPIQIVRSKVNWLELSGRYKIKKGFPAIIRRLRK